MSIVNDRINELANRFHGGSVRAMAKAANVQQRTLARVVAGAKPNVDLLQALARTHAVTVDWLLGGEAGAPEIPSDSDIPWAEALRWAELVDAVKLPPEAADAFYRLPFAVRSAATALVPTKVRTFGRREPQAVFHPATKEAIRYSLIAWTALLGAALESTGVNEVRDKIVKDVDVVRLGYNWVGSLMLATKKVKPAQVEEIALKHALKSHPSDRVRRLMEGTLEHERVMRGREMPTAKLGL